MLIELGTQKVRHKLGCWSGLDRKNATLSAPFENSSRVPSSLEHRRSWVSIKHSRLPFHQGPGGRLASPSLIALSQECWLQDREKENTQNDQKTHKYERPKEDFEDFEIISLPIIYFWRKPHKAGEKLPHLHSSDEWERPLAFLVISLGTYEDYSWFSKVPALMAVHFFTETVEWICFWKLDINAA